MSTLAVCPKCEAVNRIQLGRAKQAEPRCGRCQSELPIHEGIQDVSGTALKILVQKSPLPLVVDFWAPWCTPCRAFAPTFQQAALQHSGQVTFINLNTEKFPLAGEAYQVRGIPTLIVFQNGMEADRVSGALPLSQLLQYLSRWTSRQTP